MVDINISRVTEADFDRVVLGAGGRRFAIDDTIEKDPNADYILNEAVLELKLIEEEGLAKENRRRKVAELFRRNQADRPVVILSSDLLSEADQRTYYGHLSGPIKTAVRQAARQLESTSARSPNTRVRVLVAINVGYSAVSHEEFERIVLKCARNDTRKIDSVVVAGLYFYTDHFDYWVISHFEHFPIDVTKSFASFAALSEQWAELAQSLVTAAIKRSGGREWDHSPVSDIRYDLDGITYVKPSPQVGKPSKFWGNRRPRRNSSGIDQCPPIAHTFPDLGFDAWQRLKQCQPHATFFKNTFGEWVRFRNEQEELLGQPLQPFVPIQVTYDDIVRYCQERRQKPTTALLSTIANDTFERRVRELMLNVRDRSEATVLYNHVCLQTTEIGQDRADDLSSIVLVRELQHVPEELELIRNARLFYEWGIALAAAYCLKHGVDVLLCERDTSYGWT